MKNLTKLRKSVLTVLAMLIFSVAFSQFARNQAIELVMDDIVGADTISVNVFAAFESRTQQQDVVLLDNRTISCPYTNNWVFFIDDNPNYFWYHACRYVFVSSQNGDYTIVNEDLFPLDLETTYELISSLPGNGQITVPDYTGGSAPSENPNDHLFAVLVGGTSQSAFWTDISMIYNTLLEKGYKKENIFVHFSDAGGSYGWQGIYDDDLDGDLVLDDIDYDASLASLQTTFDNLSGVSTSNSEIPKLEHGDQLLVHFDSHGNTYDLENMGSYILVYGSNGGEYLYDYQLATWMEPLECAQMLVTMQQCFSGGFIDDLTDYITYPNTMCKNRRVITAADYDESAVMEIHVTGGNSAVPGGVYGEFDFYFYSALRGLYPDVNEFGGFNPWEPSANLGEFPFYLYPTMVGHPSDYDPDVVWGNDDGIVQVGEGFLYMDDFDTWSPNGYHYPYPGYTYTEHPQNVKTELFIEDLFTLSGLTGEVKNDQTVTGNFLIGGNITIESVADVNIANSSGFYFQDGNSRIYVDGELHIGENVLLKGQDDAFLSLLRTNTNGVLTIGTGTEFNKMRIELTGYPLMDYLLMDNLIFNNFDINGQLVSLDVLNSEFNNGWMQVSNCDDFYMDECNFNYSNLMVSGNSFTTELSKAVITDCNFSHLNATSDAVWIEQMPKYDFARNNIYGYASGLWVFNSGDAKKADISDNYILNNGENGIGIYNSHAYLRMNFIRDNGEDGLSLLNSSYVRLSGNQGAHFVSETQRFRDNGMYEIYTDEGSFPEEFKWNAVIDEDNEQDGFELVYCDTEQSIEKDVMYNYWGSEDNFHPQYDFYPAGDYSYLPIFNLVDNQKGIPI